MIFYSISDIFYVNSSFFSDRKLKSNEKQVGAYLYQIYKKLKINLKFYKYTRVHENE